MYIEEDLLPRHAANVRAGTGNLSSRATDGGVLGLPDRRRLPSSCRIRRSPARTAGSIAWAMGVSPHPFVSVVEILTAVISGSLSLPGLLINMKQKLDGIAGRPAAISGYLLAFTYFRGIALILLTSGLTAWITSTGKAKSSGRGRSALKIMAGGRSRPPAVTPPGSSRLPCYYVLLAGVGHETPGAGSAHPSGASWCTALRLAAAGSRPSGRHATSCNLAGEDAHERAGGHIPQPRVLSELAVASRVPPGKTARTD